MNNQEMNINPRYLEGVIAFLYHKEVIQRNVRSMLASVREASWHWKAEERAKLALRDYIDNLLRFMPGVSREELATYFRLQGIEI